MLPLIKAISGPKIKSLPEMAAIPLPDRRPGFVNFCTGKLLPNFFPRANVVAEKFH
jgi:hypothetical protein